MPTITAPMFLITAQQLRALRNADTVCFEANADGTGDIRALKDENHSSTGFPEEVKFAVQNRSRGMTGRRGHRGMSSYHEGWRTIVQHVLRAGDAIVLEFRPDHGTNPLCEAAHLHADEIWLVIERHKGKTDEVDRQLYFLLDSQVSLDNSSRMCSRA